ncbi:Aste57867_10399 [Aphanomyces stellatus]|uniref:Large ribosomal subunit protein mL43 n=1 Tax=Aphanomyces stellatus TaxID=120398 RepID=A0A485KQR9_9STRA|nr:hypothetical protein As57867_010359 [Aphanomyces stellatus]VFT87273.1 Aste57867_10399 [Aphanomyces stellatus]
MLLSITLFMFLTLFDGQITGPGRLRYVCLHSAFHSRQLFVTMATRGVWQLQKLTIRYCQHGGSSKNVRELLKDSRFLAFVSENPQVEFSTEIKGSKHPVLIGEYITNEKKVCDVKNQDIPFVLKQIQRMRDTSGRKMTKVNAPVISKRPTIQGIWQPETQELFGEMRFEVEHHAK